MGEYDLKSVAEHFETGGDFLSAEPIKAGHINDTYLVEYDKSRGTRHYIIQRINHEVFTDPPRLMQNLERVTAHLLDKTLAEGHSDPKRRVLTVVPTIDDRSCFTDAAGNTWRCCRYIRESVSHQQAESINQAYQAARAFGGFQVALADLPGARLHETIPNFHNTPVRYKALQQAAEADVENRVTGAQAELDFMARRQDLIPLFSRLHAEGEMPERIVHNDTKLNNVLYDATTDEALCVIDLDTVMPGLALFDFGDLVRTATSPVAEDEQDLSRVSMRLPMFEALARGYCEAAGSMLTPCEKEHLPLAGRVVALEIGMRFLTDYLDGDHYFKTQRPQHNLERCRVQFALIESMERQADDMRAAVAGL